MKISLNLSVIKNNTLQDELKKLLNLVHIMEKEYESTEPEFKPFLVGSFLNTFYKSIHDTNLVVFAAHQDVIHYLKELISLNGHVKHYLNDMHKPLVDKIIDGQFNLLTSMIKQLEAPTLSILESIEDIKIINEILDVLIKENPDHFKIGKMKEDLFRLQALLKKNSIRHQINIELQQFNAINFYGFEGVNDFKNKTKSIEDALRMYHLEALGEELNDVIPQITQAIAKVEETEAHYLKKEVDSRIEKIHQSDWEFIHNKKMMFSDLINPISQLLRIEKRLNLSEKEKDLYVTQLRSGFELCRSKDFLDLLSACNSAFYHQNHLKQQQILSYIESSLRTTQEIKSVLKKRTRFSEDPVSIVYENKFDDEPKNKKPVLILDNSYSETMQKFINILDPVAPPASRLSRHFATAMLKSLASCIWEIKEIKGTNKLMFSYDLFNLASAICPNEDLHLAQELKHRINELTTKNSMTIKGYQRFSFEQADHSNITNLTGEQFKTILSQCIDELKVYIHEDHIDAIIEQLINKWISTLQKEGKIHPEFIEKITENLHVKKNDMIAISQSSSIEQPPAIQNTVVILDNTPVNTSPEEMMANSPINQVIRIEKPPTIQNKFSSLQLAITKATTEDFLYYLSEKKKQLGPKNYLNMVLTKVGGSGYTIIQTVMYNKIRSTSNIDNIKIFFNEVKNMLSDEPSSFRKYLTHTSHKNNTILHQAALSGNLQLIKFFTGLLKDELGSEGYAKALNVKNVCHRAPYCPDNHRGSKDVNDFLDKERSKYESCESHSSSSRNRFFNQCNPEDNSQETPGKQYR